MEWFFLTLIVISAILFALTGFFDNYVTDTFFRGRRPEAQKIFSIFSCTIVVIAMLFISPPEELPLPFIFITMAAGALNSIGSIFYYRALAREETTGVTILLQFTPVIALISGIFILGETKREIRRPNVTGERVTLRRIDDVTRGGKEQLGSICVIRYVI